MLKKIDEGYDLVLGSRYVPGGSIPKDWGIHRKLMSVFGNILISFILTDFSVHDWSAGYRAITKKVYEYARAHNKLIFKEGGELITIPLDTSRWEEREESAITHTLPF